MRILLLAAVFLGAIYGCQQSPIDQSESSIQQASPELQLLEQQALAEMGLTGPVEFVDLIYYPTWCSCWSMKGVLVDSDGVVVDFQLRSRMCGPGKDGLQWYSGDGCDGSDSEWVSNSQKNRAIGVLLGFWLTHEFSDQEIAGLPGLDAGCSSPFDRTDRGSFVLSIQNDPAMFDLPEIIVHTGPNLAVAADRDPRERGSRPLNSNR